MSRTALIIAHDFPPRAVAGAHRPLRFVKYLREFGWEPVVLMVKLDSMFGVPRDDALLDQVPSGVKVFTAKDLCPYFRLSRLFGRSEMSSNQGPPPASSANKEDSDIHLSAAKRLFTWLNPLRLSKDLAELLLATPDPSTTWRVPAYFKGKHIIRQLRPDVIYSTSPPHSAHLAAAALKAHSGLPMVIDFRDPWTMSQLRFRYQSRLKTSIERRMERRCVDAADRVILNTKNALQMFRDKYSSAPEKFELIPNGFDPDVFQRLASELPRSSGPLDTAVRINMCHPGTIYGGRDLRPVVRAMRILKEQGMRVTLEQIGTVHNLDLEQYARDQGVGDSVRGMGRLPHAETLARMSEADLLLLIQYDAPTQIPGKAYEMMMFGRPIVALDKCGATSDLVNSYRIGTTAQSNDEQSIASAIGRAVAEFSSLVQSPGWQRAHSDFDGRNQTKQLASILDRVTADRAEAPAVQLTRSSPHAPA